MVFGMGNTYKRISSVSSHLTLHTLFKRGEKLKKRTLPITSFTLAEKGICFKNIRLSRYTRKVSILIVLVWFWWNSAQLFVSSIVVFPVCAQVDRMPSSCQFQVTLERKSSGRKNVRLFTFTFKCIRALFLFVSFWAGYWSVIVNFAFFRVFDMMTARLYP